jgi:hypothetical protein
VKGLAVKSAQRTVRGLAEPEGLFQHRLKHRRKVTRRGIDNLQHLRNRGFPRQPFVAFAPKVGNDLRSIGRSSGIVEDHGLTYLFNSADPSNVPDAMADTGRSRVSGERD